MLYFCGNYLDVMNFNILNALAQTVEKDTTIKEPAVVLEESIKTLITTPKEELLSSAIHYLIQFGLKVLGAFIIYFLGSWLIKLFKKFVGKVLLRRKVDTSLYSFLMSFISVFFSIILVIIIISVLGIDTTSLVAVLAGSGLAIGMALSGTLQNFAGGVMILMFKPFKVGHFIEAQGYNGTVKSIEMTTTKIITPDNKTIILPNGSLSNGVINNFTASGTRRCEWQIAISYGDDFSVAKEVILDLLKKSNLVLYDVEQPLVVIGNLADSGVVITIRAWVKSENYWDLFFYMNEAIYIELPSHGVNFPFPQIDVHLTNGNNN